MNLLIIGNGFDLTHELPTSYGNFLEYCRGYTEDKPVSEDEKLNEEFSAFIHNNVWLKYFLKIDAAKNGARTWIDFEKEIADIIKYIEPNNFTVEHKIYFNAPAENVVVLEGDWGKFEEFMPSLSTEQRRLYESKTKYVLFDEAGADIVSFIDYIYAQLRKFTRAFEIYCLMVNEISMSKSFVFRERVDQRMKALATIETCDRKLPNQISRSYITPETVRLRRERREAIEQYDCLNRQIGVVDYLAMSAFDRVLSFNYTNTYERLYGNDKTQYCYIHGKAQEDEGKTNLILGIDDALTGGKESRDFKCVRFKKYYQRIIFRTGAEYKDWLVSGELNDGHRHDVHIVGHSLDRTDYDVLYEFFSDARFRIIVYYYCQDDFEDKIKKVIQLLAYKGGNGRDELIRRVHGEQWSIKFVNQYDKVDGLFIRSAHSG